MKDVVNFKNISRFIIFNLIGILMFFVSIPIEIHIGDFSYSATTLPIDHAVSLIRSIPYFDNVYAPLIILAGAILPFIRKT